jgi:hypothetical protein
VTCLGFVGWLVGSLCWGVVADRFGRRKTYILVLLSLVLVGLLQLAIVNVASLLVARFFMGMAVGGVFVAYALLAEVIFIFFVCFSYADCFFVPPESFCLQSIELSYCRCFKLGLLWAVCLEHCSQFWCSTEGVGDCLSGWCENFIAWIFLFKKKQSSRV